MPSSVGARGAPFRSRFDRPIFIVSAPRSGSTLLFETLAQSPDLDTIGGESHLVIEGIPELSVRARGWSSNRLLAEDATTEVAERLAEAFYNDLRDREGQPATGTVRMLEKTPKNALRVPFLDAVWADAEFIFLYRDPRQVLASMMEAWQSGYFRTYPRLPGWTGLPWSLLLVPGWERLKGMALPQIVAHQWATTMDRLVADLAHLPAERVRAISYDEFLASPRDVVGQLARLVGIGWDRSLGDQLPNSQTTVSQPAPDKWRAIEAVIESIWPIVADADAKSRAFAASRKPGS
jgi:hypothetical protein